LLIAIQLTSWAMRWLPRKAWHTVHLSSCLLFVFGTIHVFTAGTDRNNHLIQWVTAMTVGVVVVLLIVRLLTRRQPVLASEASAAIDAAHEPSKASKPFTRPSSRAVTPPAVAIAHPEPVSQPQLDDAVTQHVAAVRELERVRDIARLHDEVPFRFSDEPQRDSLSPLRDDHRSNPSPFAAPRVADRIA
jgi:hypothetical protein